jgi:hypothetical protein
MASVRPQPAAARVVFDVPEGRLSFSEGELDLWAEHLVWCYRMLGVRDGATVAVQDFGTSALSFLGSALLMPHLGRGVAERLGGRFICLDASAERIGLTPAVIQQVDIDVLVVRADAAPLLAAASRQAGGAAGAARTVVAVGFGSAAPRGIAPWRYILHVESAMLLAPECAACGCFHLRGGWYALEDGALSNLKLACAAAVPLEDPGMVAAGTCAQGPDDLRLRLWLRPGGAERDE